MKIVTKLFDFFKNIAKKIVAPIQLRLLTKLSVLLQEAQKNFLISKLRSRGKNCSFLMPIHIDGPEYVEVGDNVSVAPFVHIWGQGGLKIGNRVMIASHTAITTLTHDYNQEVMYTTLIKGKVTIEDDVWIGAHSVIMPGVTIGEGAVVGAGSIVTKDVAPYSVVTGIPAKHFKDRKAKELQ